RQRTRKVNPGPLRKLMQHLYWGSPEWERIWNDRTYVEGSYGNRKNGSTENLTRSHFRVTGLALLHILTAMSAVSYNLRMVRNFHEKTGHGDPNHPLLQADPESYGFLQLTRDQHDEYWRTAEGQ